MWIYETTDQTLAARIVLTTNNQNRISTRDLKANDEVQQDMQRAFERYGLLYEHKINQYATTALAGRRIVSNEYVAQAYLSIAIKKPGDARRRKYKVWADYYGEIFSGHRAEPHVICTTICDIGYAWARAARRVRGIDDARRKLINNGIFHLARMVAFLTRKTEAFDQDLADLQVEIVALQTTPTALYPHFDDALARLEKLIIKPRIIA